MLLTHRSSIHFGDFPTWQELKKHEKHAGKSQVTAARFWYPFRKYLGIISIIAFTGIFLFVLFTSSSDDGYLFYGNMLSFCSCTLVLVSYYHVIPWRRHPSSLILQISVSSLIISIMLICTTHPTGGLTKFNTNGISVTNDNSSYDHSFGCQLMSFFMQLALIAREMWVFSLSYDLVTSITNPFASYQKNVKKYHIVIWLIAIISASVLLIQSSCQGKFLSDGTCWLRIDDSHLNSCMWSYFLGWIAVFYWFSIITMLYAYFRISKGLKSSYATRYACVAATFRVVFFYLIYCIVFYSLLIVLYLHGSQSEAHFQTNNLERITCYFIATRGFFDALVWFFSHGFSAQQQPTAATHNINTTGRRSGSRKDSFLSSFRENSPASNIYNIIMGKLHLPKAYVYNLLGNTAATTSTSDGTIGEEDPQEVANLSMRSSFLNRNSNTERPTSSSSLVPADEDELNQISDIDLSPQLNFALRAELLYLVTQGIRESVIRLNQREISSVLMSQNNIINGDASNYSSPSSVISSSQSYSTSSSAMSMSPSHFPHHHHNHFNPTLKKVGHNEDQANTECDSTTAAKISTTNQSENIDDNTNYGRKTSIHSSPVHLHNMMNNSMMSSSSSMHVASALHGNNSFHYVVKNMLYGALGMGSIPGEYGIDPISYSDHSYNSIINLPMNNNNSNKQQPLPLNSILKQPNISHLESGVIHDVISTHNRPPLKAVHIPTHIPASPLYSSSPPLPYNDDEEVMNMKESSVKTSLEDPLLQSNNDHHHHQQYLSSHPMMSYAPAEVIFYLNEKHQFRDFRPASFRRLRQMAGLSDDKYLELIAQPTKERLSEGASGAFFFFCGDGELVVKTVAKYEAQSLLQILDAYSGYLQQRTDSLLVRFLGLHSIYMYGNEFTFVVMKNIFPCAIGTRLNDRYDIKGSWINRNAKRKIPGKRATCKYCNEYYIEGSHSKCSEVIGKHEAAVTLKDNDMITKIKINPQDAYALIDVLNSDSDALCSMGLMDYSLLVGVQSVQYELEHLMNNPNIQSSQLPISSIESASAVAFQTPSKDSNRNKDTILGSGYPARAVIAPSMYYMGVIDILQTWSWTKQLEYFFKVYLLRQPPEGISCIPPNEYKVRYQKKVSQIIEHSIFVREVTGSWHGKRHVSDPHLLNVNSESFQRIHTPLSIPPPSPFV